MFDSRLRKIREALSETEVDALFVSSKPNIRYLCGFKGDSGWLLITANKVYLITDFRFIIQAKNEAPNVEVVMYEGKMLEKLKELVAGESIKTLGFESEHNTYAHYQKLSGTLPDVELKGLSSVVEQIRTVKESSELETIRQAVQIADEAFNHVLGFIKPGVKELELAAEIEYFMRKAGAEKPSFDTIIGSGFRGALPHGIATNHEVQKGDFVVMDFGAVYNGYCSDMTRTVLVGEASSKHREIYSLVLEAQLAATEAVRPGQKCSEVDAVARNLIADRGYGEYFGHGLGHGVGLDIHESPALNTRNHDQLEEGMVITVEPGVYLDGWGGVRIEDMVVVTSEGCEVLTQTGKDLVQIS